MLEYVEDLQVLQTEDLHAEVLADQGQERLLEGEAVDAEEQTVFESLDALGALDVCEHLLAFVQHDLLELLVLFVERLSLDQFGEVVVVLVFDAQQARDFPVLL